jgi:hypothetical protein
LYLRVGSQVIKVVSKSGSLALLLIFSFWLRGQRDDTAFRHIKAAENELKILEKGFLSHVEKERVETNKKMISVWDKIVSDPRMLNYEFDSLHEVSILSPKNKKFKLITWNLNRDDGSHYFFGYLLVNNSKRIKKGFLRHETIQAYEYYKLTDVSSTIKNPETFIGTTDKWFGMLYYSMVECDGYYTLLGYDPNDKLVRRKFVDVLWFKPDGTPVFGKDVFRFPKKNPRRLMFEYSSEVSMSLKYHEKRDQIVYSHLAPSKEGPTLEGLPQYYGPDGTFDALEMKKDKWIIIEDVDVRMEKTKNDKAKKPNPKDQKPVYRPN